MNAMPLVRRQTRPIDHRDHRADRQRHAELHPAVADAVIGEDADRVRADADVHRMAEAHQRAVAEDQVEADRREREDHDRVNSVT